MGLPTLNLHDEWTNADGRRRLEALHDGVQQGWSVLEKRCRLSVRIPIIPSVRRGAVGMSAGLATVHTAILAAHRGAAPRSNVLTLCPSRALAVPLGTMLRRAT